MFLGYRLYELRKDKNLSQEDLGKILGVTKVSVSGYEKGTRVPSMDILIKILDIFSYVFVYEKYEYYDIIIENRDEIKANIVSQ